MPFGAVFNGVLKLSELEHIIIFEWIVLYIRRFARFNCRNVDGGGWGGTRKEQLDEDIMLNEAAIAPVVLVSYL